MGKWKRVESWAQRIAFAGLLGLLGVMAAPEAWPQTNTYNVQDSNATAVEANRITQSMNGVPGYTRVALLGHNPDIGSGLAEDVWEGGGNYPLLTAASQLEVVSTSAADTAAGTGARTVLVSGLDANWLPISETVTLNGTTPVTTVNSYLRVNLFTTVTSGSGKVNAGDLTLRVVAAGSVQSVARAGYGFGRQAVYTVADNTSLFCGSFQFSVFTPNNTTFSAVFGIQQVSGVGNSRIPIEFQVTSAVPYLHLTQFGLTFAARTSVILRVTTTGQASTNVTANAECMLVATGSLRK